MADWVSRQCAMTGETPHQVLQRVVDESGGKWELIGFLRDDASSGDQYVQASWV